MSTTIWERLVATRNPLSLAIWNEVRDPHCTLCSLSSTASTVCLLGDGPVPAEGMVIGEAPSVKDDELELPFQGKIGQLLRTELKNIGIDPATLYITNAVACH